MKTVFAFLDKDVFAGAGVSLVAVVAPFCALLVHSLVLGCQAHERGSVSCFHIWNDRLWSTDVIVHQN